MLFGIGSYFAVAQEKYLNHNLYIPPQVKIAVIFKVF